MRIATWNVNSVRARADRVVAWLERTGTDVLAIQETKCADDKFPYSVFEAAGYEVAHTGFHQWNGVAVLSRVGLADVEPAFPGQPGYGDEPAIEARALGATCDGVRIWSLYVPHGRSPDHPHYTYKLRWLEQLRTAAAAWHDADPQAQIALLGDWNVIPLDTDVYDVADFAGHTHVTPAEREAFFAFEQAGYTEVSRVHVPAEHTYTYWDYQQLAFPKNRGLRIDFAYASPALAARVEGVRIDREERKGKGASDHVPVILDLENR
ncbi:exodeoxyribonuclease III [Isoptericola sp. b441]|uniref:Exodeoxyribonuclease III n=1 Tax=Actinotalea lenta TaxID=3064654 RepID=A0ABT9D594_9CELL|nr:MULTISPECIES: exodeoxyribonuclease III [unclassified Isoptericola]MDO8105934.1 exodeoxyribonuclease III [Isoptericola sp. b441]MDO8122649.1 exodeoxyribonuclease III [Isoptericola sp. b490]